MRRLFIVALALGACVAVARAAAEACDISVSRRNEIRSAAFTALQADGFSVEQDGFMDCSGVCKEWSPTCWGENPSSPYCRYRMKSPLFGKLNVPVYQMRADEAIVYYGCSPPTSRYFGFQSYAFISDYKLLFASLGDSTNIETVNVTSRDKSPFNREMLFITSADARTAASIATAFVKAGAASTAVNVDPIYDTASLKIDPIGNGLGHTVLATLYRVAACENKTACEAYKAQKTELFRVKHTHAPTPANVPIAMPPLRTRDNTHNEDAYSSAMAQLVSSVTQHYTRDGTVRLASTDTLLPLYINGRDCITDGTDCLGDTRDALYSDGDEALRMLFTRPSDQSRVLAPFTNATALSQLTARTELARHAVQVQPNGPEWPLTNDTRDFLVVIGVLHHLTKPIAKATYSNLAAYYVDKQMGVGAVLDSDMRLSAVPFLPHSSPFADSLYVQKFSRSCDDPSFCFRVPVSFPGVPLSANMSFVERAYLQPSTHVGPDGHSLQHPIVLHFLPSKK